MVGSSKLAILDFLEKCIHAEIKNLEKEIFNRKKVLAKIGKARLEIRRKRNDSDKQQRDRGS